MRHILKNKNLEIQIDLPLTNYNFSRFDWTGKIVSVRYKDISVSTTEKLDDVDENQYGKGFYNEFGIDAGIGTMKRTKAIGFKKLELGY